jgi:hypothetical protein
VRVYRWPFHSEVERPFRLPPLVELRLRYLCSPYPQNSGLFGLSVSSAGRRCFRVMTYLGEEKLEALLDRAVPPDEGVSSLPICCRCLAFGSRSAGLSAHSEP